MFTKRGFAAIILFSSAKHTVPQYIVVYGAHSYKDTTQTAFFPMGCLVLCALLFLAAKPRYVKESPGRFFYAS